MWESIVVLHYPTWWEGADCMWESIVVLHYPTLVGRSRLYVGKVSIVVLHYPTGGKEQTVRGKVL